MSASGSRGGVRELQGFRGIAALSTVVFHVWQQYWTYDAEGGHPPVADPYLAAGLSFEVIDLFFVMSAYLLTLSYARAAIDGGSIRTARDFLFRRAIRILPLYVIAVLVVWAGRNPGLPGDWRDLVEHLTFTHVFDSKRIFYTLGPVWSLSLEVAFYLVLVTLGPLGVRACRSIGTRRGRVAACAGACALLYLIPVAWIAVAHHAFGVPHTDWPVYFGPQARFGGFAVGMSLAVAMVALGPRRGTLRAGHAMALQAASVVLLYLLSLASNPENTAFTFYHPAASALWGVLLYATLHVRGGPEAVRWNAVLRAGWLNSVGLVSYSLFIWHEPIMLQLYNAGLLPADGPAGFPWAVPIVLAVAVPAAVLSYWLIEYPASLLGRLKDPAGRPREFYPEPARW